MSPEKGKGFRDAPAPPVDRLIVNSSRLRGTFHRPPAFQLSGFGTFSKNVKQVAEAWTET